MPGIKDKKKNRLQQGGAKRPASGAAKPAAKAGGAGGSVWSEGTPDMSKEAAHAKHLKSLETVIGTAPASTMPEGLCVVENFITESEEKALLEFFNNGEWDADTGLARRTQQWGFCFSYESMTVVAEGRPLPVILEPILKRMQDVKARPATDPESLPQFAYPGRPSQMIVNEYTAGQGIAPHIDRKDFGDAVATIGLGSHCTFELDRKDAVGATHIMGDLAPAPGYAAQATGVAKSPYHKAVLFPRRALLIMKGPARHHWTHSIPFRTYDDVDGKRIPRTTRVSLTFRTMTPKALERLGAPAIDFGKGWAAKQGEEKKKAMP